MEEFKGYTLDEVIAMLEALKLNLGTGDVEVTLPQVLDDENDEEVHYNAHISYIEESENDNGETIVVIF